MRIGILASLVLLAGCPAAEPGICASLVDDCAAAPAPGGGVGIGVERVVITALPRGDEPAADVFPDDLVVQDANNNLDLVWFAGRLFFAFRTAPTHFASSRTELHVMSSPDGRRWESETTISLARDLREPRFLAVGSRLFLYFAVLGTSMTDFEPGQPKVIERLGAGDWSEPEDVFVPGTIPWRGRVVGAADAPAGFAPGATLVTYRGVGDVTSGSTTLEVSWLRTEDGRTFTPAVGETGVVRAGGNGETDWAFSPDGGLVSVSRNEFGEEGRYGSIVCAAAPGELGSWSRCRYDPRKFDSPLMLRHGENVFLIARRQVTEDGRYDLMLDDVPESLRALQYTAGYWTTPKRCAVWRVDPESLSVDWVADLPTNGDTCFASAIPLEGDLWLLYDYRSPLEDERLGWRDAQVGPTSIYALTMRLPAGEFVLPEGPPAPPAPLPPEPGDIMCGERSCGEAEVTIGRLEFTSLDPCCVDTNTCGIDTDAAVIAGFDELTPAGLLSLEAECFPLEAPAADCSAHPAGAGCGCPEHVLRVPDPLDAEGEPFLVPLRGCCRIDGSCGYQVDTLASEPALPITLQFDLGCVDPSQLAAEARGPAVGMRCVD